MHFQSLRLLKLKYLLIVLAGIVAAMIVLSIQRNEFNVKTIRELHVQQN